MSELRIYASEHTSGKVDDGRAVIVSPTPQVIVTMSIAQARDISNRLARAADDAELKLKN